MQDRGTKEPGSAGLSHWLTIKEVIEVTRLSRSLVYMLISSGDLESARVGRAVRVDAQQLAQWMASKSTEF